MNDDEIMTSFYYVGVRICTPGSEMRLYLLPESGDEIMSSPGDGEEAKSSQGMGMRSCLPLG